MDHMGSDGSTTSMLVSGSGVNNQQTIRGLGTMTTTGNTRPPGILSCDSCRHRKLRCDRHDPCSNCTTRDIPCNYTLNAMPRMTASGASSRVARRRMIAANNHSGASAANGESNGNGSGSDHTRPIDRVRRLEELVASLTADRHGRALSTGCSVGSEGERRGRSSVSATPGEGELRKTSTASCELPPSDRFGRLEVNNGGQMVYLSAAHWATICDEISTIKDSLGDDLDLSDEDNEFIDQQSAVLDGPLLMQGLTRPLSIEDVIQAVPSKLLADRLVYRYFAANDHSAVIHHVPTFQDEYNQFWMDPYGASLAWVSILFSILTTAVALSLQAGDALPGLPSDPMTTIANFHQRSTECLLLSHYWKPKLYTIEALLMNLQIEFIRSKDADLSVWTLAGTITRLAMSMGYHRDPAQYSQISCFHGEMRRRVWAGIVQLDVFFSFQLGLPRMIDQDQCDVLSPRNLLDTDFDIHVTELPPARPDTEYTPPSYTIAKGRLMAVFAQIGSLSCSVQPTAYHHYLSLDKRLNEAYAAVPDHLRVPFHDAGVTLTVAAPVLVRQHLLELLYQKSRCILHREYMVKARNDSTFMYSRSTCVDAAMALLAQQVTVRTQVQDGSVLHRDRWLIMTSLHHTDFILAAMIVCLELSFRIEGGPRQPRLVDELGHPRYENAILVQALRGSYQIWLEWKGHAKVSPQAARILSVMLSRAALAGEVDVGSDCVRTSDFPRPGTAKQNGSHHGSGHSRSNGFSSPEQEHPCQASGEGVCLEGESGNNEPPSPNVFAIEEMIDSPGLIDWDLWEAHMRNVSAGRNM